MNPNDATKIESGDDLSVTYESIYADRGNRQDLTGEVTSIHFTLRPDEDGGYLCASVLLDTTGDGRADKRLGVDGVPEGRIMGQVETLRRGHDTRTSAGLRSRSGAWSSISRRVETVEVEA